MVSVALLPIRIRGPVGWVTPTLSPDAEALSTFHLHGLSFSYWVLYGFAKAPAISCLVTLSTEEGT
jgi:hypothetical protein